MKAVLNRMWWILSIVTTTLVVGALASAIVMAVREYHATTAVLAAVVRMRVVRNMDDVPAILRACEQTERADIRCMIDRPASIYRGHHNPTIIAVEYYRMGKNDPYMTSLFELRRDSGVTLVGSYY